MRAADIDGAARPSAGRVVLGLRANWPQFALLVLINAFVGGMVGIERTVVPLIGAEEFGIASTTLVVSFIVSFGVVKAFANLVSGHLADVWGRKRVLVLGWLIGLPVPFMIMWAPSWGWVVAANALLGVNQGLAWSMTVIMKVDLVGPKSRGLAVGLNEFAGYLAVGVTAFLTGYLAAQYGLRPAPIYLGVGYALAGALLSILLVRDTRDHVRVEIGDSPREAAAMGFWEVFALTSFRDRNLFAASQAGLVNNLNDGMSWGIFPLYFAAFGLGVERIGVLKAVYPATWGVLQVATGPLSDRWGRKGLIVAGMWVQSAGLFVTAFTREFHYWLIGSLLLGVGTAMVYPPCGAAARLLAPFDPWLGRKTTLGAAFIAVSATKPFEQAQDAPSVMQGSEMKTPPILLHKRYDASSAFTPESLLREGRRQKGLSAAAVPEICVLDPDGDITRHLLGARRADRHPGWACYHTDLHVFRHEGREYGIVGCAVGAAFAVLVAEELFASGCQFLISVTSAGQILPLQAPPYFIIIDRALRDEGASYHYLPPSDYSEANAHLTQLVREALATAGISVQVGASWTTDAPFRETQEAIDAALEAGILAVEMEAAALYAFAKARSRSVLCFAHVTNQMGRIEGDFEKGAADGAEESLRVISLAAERWRTERQS